MKNFKICLIALFLFAVSSCDPKESAHHETDNAQQLDINFPDNYEPFYTEESDTAVLHNLSTVFRQLSGLCKADTAEANFFELTYAQAQDMVHAMRKINQEAASVGLEVPVSFRLIYGQSSEEPQANKIKLILVGLDSKNGAGQENNYIPYTKLIDGYLPCPRQCDVNVSFIAVGQNGPCELDE